MSELEVQIGRFLEEMVRRNWSVNTRRAYAADLKSFLVCFPGQVSIAGFKVGEIRIWMSVLYDEQLGARSIRRHVSSLKAFFHFLKRDGLIALNPVKLVRIPKLSRPLPPVLTVRQTATLIDNVEAMATNRSQPIRDLAILEILYGCGLRVSELVGLNLEDIDRTECWLLIRGKGRKERQVPYGSKAKAALERYLGWRHEYLAAGYRRSGRTPSGELHRIQPGSRHGYWLENALFLNFSRKRLSVRYIGKIVKQYGIGVLGDPGIHPHSFRHAFATHLMDSGAGIREIQDLLGHASLSTTQIYTQVSPAEMIAVYDNAHPRSGK